jgi:hypothetical protein
LVVLVGMGGGGLLWSALTRENVCCCVAQVVCELPPTKLSPELARAVNELHADSGNM